MRQVIVRVLRPVAALPSTEESGSSSATEVHAIDAADAGAIDVSSLSFAADARAMNLNNFIFSADTKINSVMTFTFTA